SLSQVHFLFLHDFLHKRRPCICYRHHLTMDMDQLVLYILPLRRTHSMGLPLSLLSLNKFQSQDRDSKYKIHCYDSGLPEPSHHYHVVFFRNDYTEVGALTHALSVSSSPDHWSEEEEVLEPH